MPSEHASKEVSRLLADDYSQKILVSTYASPMSAQRLSRICQIPIAACYRRIHELEQAGLLGVDREKEVYKGRKVRLYKCRLRSATIRFNNGKFHVRYDTEPENGNDAMGIPLPMPELPKLVQ
jgi:predicted ArsR family transcriptional regulator